jgi:thiol:disulfide interchange protein DsbG
MIASPIRKFSNAVSPSRFSWRRLLAAACLVAAPAFASAAPTTVTATQWKALEASHWLEDGRASAPRTIYMFTDPNCPYCNKLWTDARPWVEAGKVQIRHLVVGILTPTSNGKAATLLNGPNPAKALAEYEKGQSFSTAQMIASGKVHALNAEVLQPLAPVPPRIQSTLDANKNLMLSLGLEATPAVVWRDERGQFQILQGIAPEDESRVFGPR